MKQAAVMVDDLIPDVQAPDDKIVVAFPNSGSVRTQDVVLRLLLEGKGYAEIATIVDKSPKDVEKIARSEWASREITAQLATAEPEAQRDTLQNLIRIQAFDAVQKIGTLIKSPSEGIALQACKLALQYSLPIPTKELTKDNPAGLPSKPEDIKAEYDRIQREIKSRQRAIPA